MLEGEDVALGDGGGCFELGLYVVGTRRLFFVIGSHFCVVGFRDSSLCSDTAAGPCIPSFALIKLLHGAALRSFVSYCVRCRLNRAPKSKKTINPHKGASRGHLPIISSVHNQPLSLWASRISVRSFFIHASCPRARHLISPKAIAPISPAPLYHPVGAQAAGHPMARDVRGIEATLVGPWRCTFQPSRTELRSRGPSWKTAAAGLGSVRWMACVTPRKRTKHSQIRLRGRIRRIGSRLAS